MTRFLTSLPFFVLLIFVGSVAMLVPALHALTQGNHRIARIFFYGAILFSVLAVLIGIARRGYQPKSVPRSQISALLAAFTVLPVLFALPLYEALGTVPFIHAWFEMVSAFTTTGATLYDNPARLLPTLHLWRGMVGWMGGFLVWTAAIAILAPMNLGGFEVRALSTGGGRHAQISRIADPSERLAHYSFRLAPIYVGLTIILWVGLMIAGESPVVAVVHAMGTVSTSGISAVGAMPAATAGLAGEMLVFAFFVFALSRRTFSLGLVPGEDRGLRRDPELQLAAVIVAAVTLLLFLRHFVAAGPSEGNAIAESLGALWGTLFTVTSFLTTTGYESAYWFGATEWSGLGTPGLVLVGVALIGGGVATTAGGVKLLRVYALYKHGERELERLVYPSSVGGSGAEARRIRRQGAEISWIFFMLFALSIMVSMLLLSLTGVQFETAMILAAAAMSTTGPLAAVAAEAPISYAGIPDSAKVVLAAVMVVGRLETLALVALLNPDFWRD